ncbi:NAD(P)-binding domain-containing protein [Mariniblastus fucicola]|uniref:FAD-dependent oxidoreductase n=1 Tax=Mariniblastus fucicola TaxID=980251 RepID=A0A5B9P9G8_9BACT|nr:NAD(P)-binding domain-containing protein [Mariniblastus fucicola]QEG23004.1 FAD-dependent oxidoreductase [Mariniblastus fucicola]
MNRNESSTDDLATPKPEEQGLGCCTPKAISLDDSKKKNPLPTNSCCGGNTDAKLPITKIVADETLAPVDLSQLNRELPVVVIGAGPVGLAAAANLVERKQNFIVLESGKRVAASMWQWRHVRLFTPWSFLMHPAGLRLLRSDRNWQEPDADRVPLAGDLIDHFLDPLSKHSDITPQIKLNHKVVSVSREGHDLMKDGQRNEAPFLLVVETPQGPQRFKARAVIDASGTWTTPNPLGAGGVLADGERRSRDKIQYGMPDIFGTDRERYAGKRVLVVGSGHSATGNVLGLVELATTTPDTSITWAIRRSDPTKLWGGGDADEIAERGALGSRVKNAVDDGKVTLLTGLSIAAVNPKDNGLEIVDVDGQTRAKVDEVIVASGARPDLSMLRELRLEFDPATEATKALGPLIDPNHHSCGSVLPHGAAELQQPERGFYLAGMKSYGRAPTFLLMTGYEQVRSIVAELAGDHEAARNVELQLPSTGVCSTDFAFAESVTPSA